jgi:hypothetical protein
LHSKIETPFVQVEYPAGYVARPHVAAAFTVAEFGEMLPKWIWICKDSTCFCTGYALNPDLKKPMSEKMPVEICDAIGGATTEADARAKMLVHLVENKVM